jgi:hypothetical protein
MDFLVQLFDSILASIGRRDARQDETNHWVEEINAHYFCNPNAFSVVDILIHDKYYTAQDFINQVAILLA